MFCEAAGQEKASALSFQSCSAKKEKTRGTYIEIL